MPSHLITPSGHPGCQDRRVQGARGELLSWVHVLPKGCAKVGSSDDGMGKGGHGSKRGRPGCLTMCLKSLAGSRFKFGLETRDLEYSSPAQVHFDRSTFRPPLIVGFFTRKTSCNDRCTTSW